MCLINRRKERPRRWSALAGLMFDSSAALIKHSGCVNKELLSPLSRSALQELVGANIEPNKIVYSRTNTRETFCTVNFVEDFEDVFSEEPSQAERYLGA